MGEKIPVLIFPGVSGYCLFVRRGRLHWPNFVSAWIRSGANLTGDVRPCIKSARVNLPSGGASSP